jgi:lactoylglutathione lyase
MDMADSTDTPDFNPDYWVWGEDEIRPRFLHTMIRVKDFEESLRFYCDTLGMKVLDRFDIESRRVTALFVGYDGYRESALLEITQKWDTTEYTHGTGYGHIALGMPDLVETVGRLEAAGFEITEPPKVVMEGGPMVAFVKDPDGFAVELIQIQKA